MTSTWIQSHPASSMARISSPRRAKSAERMEGAILTGLCITKALATGRQLRNSRKSKSGDPDRSEEHTSELQSLMRISYAVFCLKKKKNINKTYDHRSNNTNIT